MEGSAVGRAGYMEVAVNTSGKSGSRLLIAGVLLLAAVAGCQQEIISTAPASRSKGVKEYNEGNYADAAGSFKAAIRSDPRDYKSQYFLARSYEELKQYQQAIQAYKASLDAQPRTLVGREDAEQRLTTLTALAGCITKSGNSDSELNVAEQKARATDQPEDYLLVAKIHQNRGDADSALDALNRGAIADPTDFNIVKEHGLYLEQVGQRQKAIQQLRRAYGLKANDVAVNDALRRLNVVPGPALKREEALVKPPLPEGPLPEVDLSKFRVGGSREAQSPQQAAPAGEATSDAAPAPAPAAPRAEYSPRD
jgi:tetratricopeptide (TPR) repeat protein